DLLTPSGPRAPAQGQGCGQTVRARADDDRVEGRPCLGQLAGIAPPPTWNDGPATKRRFGKAPVRQMGPATSVWSAPVAVTGAPAPVASVALGPSLIHGGGDACA